MLVLTDSGAAADVSGAEDPGPEQAARAATATTAIATEPALTDQTADSSGVMHWFLLQR